MNNYKDIFWCDDLIVNGSKVTIRFSDNEVIIKLIDRNIAKNAVKKTFKYLAKEGFIPNDINKKYRVYVI